MTASLIEQPPYTYLFYALVIAWGLVNARLHFRDRGDAVQREDGGSRRILGLATAAAIVAAVAVYEAVPVAGIPAPRLAFWLGVALFVIGAAIREYAVRTLGRYFTLDLAADAGQPVVDRGPYAWVRHPSYTGAFVSLVGVGLVLSNWLSLAVVTAGVGAGYWYRIRTEEQLLRAELGGAYEEYAERTPYRLIPGVW